MPRPGYTNIAPAEERGKLLATICAHLALDPEQHSARVDAIDYALRVAAREIEETMNFVKRNYPIGKKLEVPHPDTGKPVQGTVENHYTGSTHKVDGIVVRVDDGTYTRVEASYLAEDGSGVYE